MKTILFALRLQLALIFISAGACSQNIFISPVRDAGIYHESWIDFNKNGKKDVYEDTGARLEDRISDLLNQGQNRFLVVFNAEIEGIEDQVIMLNRDHVVWVVPREEAQGGAAAT